MQLHGGPFALLQDSDVLGQELLDSLNGSCLVFALGGDGDGLALTDAHAHHGHQLAHIAGLAVLLDGDGAGILLGQLDQQAGGTCVDAEFIFDGILELFHGS